MNREEFMVSIIKKIGDFQRHHFKKEVFFRFKGDTSEIVSFVDTESENMFIDELQSFFPEDNVLGEETYDSSRAYPTNSLWVIDPLDGTLMFQRGIPGFGPMICYIKNGEIILSALYNPITNELFVASKEGAFCNGEKIFVSDVSSLKSAIICGHIEKSSLPTSCKLLNHYSAITHFTLVCKGLVDGYVGGITSTPWDVLPGIFLAKQAGANIRYDSLLEPGLVIVAAPKIFAELEETSLKNYGLNAR